MVHLCNAIISNASIGPQCISAYLSTANMEFKQEELVEREIELACYLRTGLSLKDIALKTGLSKKILTAHFRNMMEKLKAADMNELTELVRGGAAKTCRKLTSE